MEINSKPVVSRVIIEVLSYFSLFFIFPVLFFYFIGAFEPYIAIIFFFVFVLFILIMSLSIGGARNTNFRVNEEFISRKKLFISEHQDDIPVSQITNVDYKVSWFLDRIFGTGSVLVYTSGSGGAEIIISNVKDYNKIYEEIENLIDTQKNIEAKKRNDTSYVKSESKLKITLIPEAGLGTFFSLIPLIGLFILPIFFSFTIFNNIISSVFLIFGIFIYFVILFSIIGFVYGNYKKTRYDFYTDKLIYYRGFLSLNKSTVPYERVTNISLFNPLLLRLFGLSMIQVETSGSISSNININYIKDGEKIIEDLREVLRENGRN